MTLEDFFTLTEMKEGLMVPARVEELISVMRKESDIVVKNVADTTRQWSAVASTIAATESKDCLDLFIQLDGLWFIDMWLKDALKLGKDASDSYVEESITAMLHTLQKLHLDSEKSISSGIWITVKDLLGHSSSKIQDMARVLFDSWKQGGVGDADYQSVDKVGASHDDESTVSVKLALKNHKPESVTDSHLSKEIGNDQNCVLESMTDKIVLSRTSGGLQPEKFHDAHKNGQFSPSIVLDPIGTMDKSSDSKLSSPVSTSIQEIPIKETPPMCKSEGTGSNETCSSVPGEGCARQLDDLAEDAKQTQKLNSSLYELSSVNLSSASSLLEPQSFPSGVDSVSTQACLVESFLRDNVDDGKGAICQKTVILGDTAILASVQKSRFNDMEVSDSSKAREYKITRKIGDCYDDILQESSKHDPISGKLEDIDASLSRMEDIGICSEDKNQDVDGSEDLPNTPDFSKSAMNNIRSPHLLDNRNSHNELDYCTVDALEVARQVAQEVEREVIGSGSSSSEKIVGRIRKRRSQDPVNEKSKQSTESLPHVAQEMEREVIDYNQRSGSSSSEKIIGRVKKCCTPDCVAEKSDQSIKNITREFSSRKNLSVNVCQEGDEHLTDAHNLAHEQENCKHDMDSSQLTEAAHDLEANTQKGMCGFDLNEEVCSDDIEHQVSPIFNPISFVSESRPAAAPGFPADLLQFEGMLGWKGSAANSAFQPASPRRISESGKTVSDGGTYNSSKQTQGCLDFDLNVADEEYKVSDPISTKIPASSDLPSGESSVEVSSQKSGRLKLDLNRFDDHDTPVCDFPMEGRLFFPPIGYRSPSPASSSSCMQPSQRNIDLNGPFLHNEFTDQGPYNRRYFQNLSSNGVPIPDEPVVSIMGTKIQVHRKDLVPRTKTLLNGKTLESGMDANMARNGSFLGTGTRMPHTHSPFFGYAGLTPGPTMSSSVHGSGGSIPYMVDSRGAPVVPQIVGSASTLSPFPQPFILSMPSAPSSLHAVDGLSRPNFDLNSGFVMEGNIGSPVFRQHFVSEQGRSGEEHLRANTLPSSSSGICGKRKEPEHRWESYPFTYKHQQPPWK